MNGLSTCCDAPPKWDTDLCSDCKEHADFYNDNECDVCGGEGEIWYSGDHMIFVQNGVPAVAITSEHGMTGLAQISHTPKDQPELVDCSKLVTTAFALKDLLLELNV